MRIMEKLIEKIITSISNKFKINPKREVSKIEEIKTLKPDYPGETVHLTNEGILIFTTELEKNPFFLEELIVELSKLFFPKILLTVKRSIDIGYYIAYKLSKQKTKWLTIWERKSKPIYIKNIAYRPTYDLFEIDKVTDGKAIKIILNFFDEVGKYKTELNLEDYLFFYDSLQKEIKAKLSKIEYKLLLYISKKGDLIKNPIQNMEPKVFKKNYARLKRHVWLNFLPFINWPKIGLEYFIVLVKPVSRYTSTVKEKLSKPYVRVIHQLGGGEGSKLIFMCALPFGNSYVLEQFFNELKNEMLILDYQILRPMSYIHTMNFENFNYLSNEWEIDEKLIRKYVNEKLDSSILENMKLTFDYSNKTSEFDKLDVDILFELEKPPGVEYRINRLVKKLKKTSKILKTKIEKLEEKHFFKVYPTIYPPLVNLPETIFLIIKTRSQETSSKIFYLLNKLPNNYVSEFNNGYCLFSINSLPGKINYISKILVREIMKLQDVIDVNIYFEHVTYQTRHLSSKLYVEDSWADPVAYWLNTSG
ncbi:MAG: hypothetical protein ACTSYQ_03385 [Candidatus Odinarchaeia archaeon]